jgi:hypothetical protein
MVMDAHHQIRKLRRSRRPLALRSLLGLALLLGLPVAGQSPYAQFPAPTNGKSNQHYPDSTVQFGQEASPNDKRIKILNAERQKAIVSDTARLLKLAKELNDEMAETGSASMTDAQLRKVAEIGKLARSVKDKMSFTAGGYPGLNTPPPAFDVQ